jgi:hypothetical protein
MEMTKTEFENTFKEMLDHMLEDLAVNPEIDVKKFYGMVCFLENLSYFWPVIYGLIENEGKSKAAR